MLVPPNFYVAWVDFQKSLGIEDMEGKQMLTREGEKTFYDNKEQVTVPLDYYSQLKINEYLLERVNNILKSGLDTSSELDLIKALLKGMSNGVINQEK